MSHNNSALGTEVARAWWDLEQALAAYNSQLQRDLAITGRQLALLRIIAERQPVTIRRLRSDLHWHPASLGQTVQRLVNAGSLSAETDSTDKRRRVLTLTNQGEELIAAAPLVGAVRLRSQPVPEDELKTMLAGFTTAIKAFGLASWSEHATTLGDRACRHLLD